MSQKIWSLWAIFLGPLVTTTALLGGIVYWTGIKAAEVIQVAKDNTAIVLELKGIRQELSQLREENARQHGAFQEFMANSKR